MVGSRSSLRFRTGGLAWSRAWGRACGWGVAAALLLTAHPGAAQFEPIVPGPSEAVELELVLAVDASRSEEHTSELQSLMRISYAVFCLKQKQVLAQLEHNTLTAYRRVVVETDHE